jgi:endonuclease/exonuclease/phosphatase family metal-dependent hydrolase
VVLLSEHWLVSTYHVDNSTLRGRFASDHYPVLVEARIS